MPTLHILTINLCIQYPARGQFITNHFPPPHGPVYCIQDETAFMCSPNNTLLWKHKGILSMLSDILHVMWWTLLKTWHMYFFLLCLWQNVKEVVKVNLSCSVTHHCLNYRNNIFTMANCWLRSLRAYKPAVWTSKRLRGQPLQNKKRSEIWSAGVLH